MSDHARLAAAAAADHDLPAPVLVRTGMNTLFAAGDDVMIRVGRQAWSFEAEQRWHGVMSAVGVRTPAQHWRVDAEDGLAVVAIQRVHPSGEVDWRAVGAMVRRLHSLPVDAAAELPWCGDFPHWQVDDLLRSLRSDIDEAALAGLDACVARWSGWRERMRNDLVMCHGDIHPGNVMQSVDGPVLIDWDMRCLAPAGWDHGPMLQWSERWTDRWGGGPHAYDHFAEGYGISLRDDWMTGALAAMRMVIATLMRVRAGRTDVVAAAEAERRLRYWRGDPNAPLWDPQ